MRSARGIPLTWTGFTHSQSNPASTQGWIKLARQLQSEGIGFYPQLSPRTVDFRLNWDSSMLFMSMPKGWHRIIAAKGDEKAQLLRDPAWRDAAREEWDRVEKAMFPHRRPELVRFVEVQGEGNECWLGHTLADLVADRGGHPSDVFADFVLANDCRPGVVAQGMANTDVAGMGRTLADPAVLISSSDAGAHMQMLCASGDTTLVLTRHVRERHDLTLPQAVHELTGQWQARGVRLSNKWAGSDRAGQRGRPGRVRARRIALRRRRVRPRPARRRVPSASPRRRIPGHVRRRCGRPGGRRPHRRPARSGHRERRVAPIP